MKIYDRPAFDYRNNLGLTLHQYYSGKLFAALFKPGMTQAEVDNAVVEATEASKKLIRGVITDPGALDKSKMTRQRWYRCLFQDMVVDVNSKSDAQSCIKWAQDPHAVYV